MTKYNYNKNSKGNRRGGKQVIYKGEKFDRQKDLAIHLGLPESRISRALRFDKDINKHYLDYAL